MDADKITIETIKSWGYLSTLKYQEFNSATTLSLNQPQWPACLDQFDQMSMNTHGAKIIRSIEIASMVPTIDNDSKILDFGCGEGYLTSVMRRFGKKIIGYDKVEYESWTKCFDKKHLYNDLSSIDANKPFKLIIGFDTIDHMSLEELLAAFTFFRKVLHDNGYIYLRCHPFSSRHGRHLLYNKSFIHLVLNSGELKMNNIDIGNDIKVIKPLNFYDDFFKLVSFKVKSKLIHNSIVEDFVVSNLLEKIKINHYNLHDDYETIKANMAVDFIDYLLSPN